MAKHELYADPGVSARVLNVNSTGDPVVIPDAHLLFTADFQRSGNDLVLTGKDGQVFIVEDYFAFADPPHLQSPEGAYLFADVVQALAGPLAPGQYAQAGSTEGKEPIGQVETLEGTAFATRTDGTKVELKVGDPVFQGDVVETGPDSKLGVTFIDETVFSLSEDARMVLDELVYDPGGSDNSMLVNLVQGSFVFVAGQVAPSGDMKVQTPVATMGIRGTTVIAKIGARDGTSDVSLAQDPNGKTGLYEIIDTITKQVLAIVDVVGVNWRISPTAAAGEGAAVTQVAKSSDELALDQAALAFAFKTYSTAQQRIAQTNSDNTATDGGTPGSGLNTGDDPGAPPDLNDGGGSGGDGGGEGGEGAEEEGEEEEGGGEPTNTAPFADAFEPVINTDGFIQPTDEDTETPFTFEPDKIFAFRDVDPGDAISVITIKSLPGENEGVLLFNGEPVVVDQTIDAADIGGLSYSPNGDFEYLATGEVAGVLFDYTVKDLLGAESLVATATILVHGVNDVPVAAPDTGAGHENETLTIDVLANDTDVDHNDNPSNFSLDQVSIASVSGAVTTGGSVSIVGNQLVFNPGTDFDVLDSGDQAFVTVDYTMSDDEGAASTSQVQITVTGTNDAPVAVPDTGTGTENQTLTIDVLANDTDVDGDDSPANFSLDSVSIASVTGAVTTGGSVSIVGNQLVFNPGSDFDVLDTGDQAFVMVDYTMSDNEGAASSAQAVITVIGTNDAPVAFLDVSGGNENDTLTIDVLVNDTDVDGDDGPANFTLDNVTIASVSGDITTIGGTVSVDANERLVFNPGAHFDSLDETQSAVVIVNYTMSDDENAASNSTATISISGVNDAPTVVLPAAQSTSEDVGININGFVINDVDDDVLTVTLTANSTITLADASGLTSVQNDGSGVVTIEGTLAAIDAALNAGSGLLYTPTQHFSGLGTIQFQIDDGVAPVVTDTLSITIDPVADAPQVAITDPSAGGLDEDAAFALPVSASLVDTDGSETLTALTISGLPVGFQISDGTNSEPSDGSTPIDILGWTLANLQVTPALNFNGGINLSVSATATEAANGDTAATVQNISLTIDPVNDAPVNTVPGPQSVDEDVDLVLTGLSIADVDSGETPGGQLEVTLAVTKGTVTVGTPAPGATLDANGTAAVKVSGTLTQINDTLGALNNITYRGDLNVNGAETLTVTTSDLGNTGSGGIQTDADLVQITINPVSDAPQGTDNTLTINEDTAHTFSAADFGFSDPDDAPAPDNFTGVKITTLPTDGTLTLNGGAVTAGQVVTAPELAANQLVFTPDADENGTGYAALTFQVQDDGANPGETEDQSPNTITFDVTPVSDAPEGADNTLTINEDTAHTFVAADFGFSDPKDTPADNFTGIKIVSGSGSGALTLNGSPVGADQVVAIADINAGLLVFTPGTDENGTGYASYTFQVQDDGANPGETEDQSPNTITFDVMAINDGPVISIAEPALPNPLVHYTFDSADVNIAGQTIENTANPGTHEITSVGFTSTAGVSGEAGVFDFVSNNSNAGIIQDDLQVQLGTGSVTFSFWTDGPFTGTLLGNFEGFTDTRDGISTLGFNAVSMSGGGNANQGTALTNFQTTSGFTHLTYVLNVNPGVNDDTLTAYQDGVLVGTTSLIDHGGSNNPDDWRFETDPSNDFAFGRRTYDDIGSSSLSFLSGTIDELRIFDGALTASEAAAVYSADSGMLLADEDAPLAITGIQISDADIGETAGGKLTVTLSVGEGTITVKDDVVNGVTAADFVTANGIGTVTFSGTLDQINTTLADANGVTYQGDLNFNGTDQLQITVNDQGNTGTDPNLTGTPTSEEATATIDIAVNPVNDDPTATGVSGTVTVEEDVPASLDLSGITLADVDAGTGTLILTLTATNGTLAGPAFPPTGITVGGSGGTLTLEGTLTALNDILQDELSDIQYTGALNANGTGADAISFTLNDQGNTGSGGGTDIALGSISVDITAVNDDPTGATVPATITAVEDTASDVDLTGLTIADVDAGNGSLRLILATGGGTLTAAAGTGITVIDNGTDTLELQGTLTNLNTYLGTATNIQYTGALNANGTGADTIDVSVFDQGNTGTGGDEEVALGTISVDITPVNDAPVLAGLDANAYQENTVNAGPQAIDTAVAVTDVDSADLEGGSLAVTYSSGGGTEDSLSVLGTGSGGSGIEVAGSVVSFNGTAIGTVTSSGAAGADLVISFNQSGNPGVAAVQALIEDLGYANSSDTPTAARTVSITVADGDGGMSIAQQAVLTVNAENDDPVFNGFASAIFQENTVNAGPVVIDANVSVSDPDSADFEGGSLTVTYASGGGTEDQLSIVEGGGITDFDGTISFNGTAIAEVSTTDNGGNGASLVISFNQGGNPDAAAIEALIEALGYSNTSDTPTELRTIGIVVTDGDGGTSLQTQAVLTVNAENDNPVFNGFSSATFQENTVNAAPVVIDSNVTVSDPDSADFEGGSLTVNYAAGGGAEDQLSIVDGGGITETNGTISFNGTAIAAVSATGNGANGANLVINFNQGGNPDPAAIEALIEALGYSNTSDTPAALRTIGIVVTDGDGGTSLQTQSVLTVNAENDAPEATPGAVVSDDFNDNALDASLWNVVLPGGITAPAVTETGGQLELENRGYLVSVQEFPPSASAPVTIEGEWTPQSNMDVLHITTRTDAVAGNSFGQLVSGVQVSAQAVTQNIRIGEQVGGHFQQNDTASMPGLVIGKTYTFTVVDDGFNITATFTEVGNAANTATVTGTNSFAGTGGHVVIHNREQLSGVDQTAQIDNLSISNATVVDYTENDPATAVSPDIVLSDADDTNLEGATIRITGNHAPGEDVLAAVTTGTSITANFVATTGTLTLSGTDTIANYQAVIRSVTYQNTSETPSESQRTVEIVVDDGTDTSTASVSQINVTAVNDAPVVSLALAGIATEDGAALVALNPFSNTSDADGDTLSITNIQSTLPDGVTFGGGVGAGNTSSRFSITNPGSDNITLANAQDEVGDDTTTNPDVTGGNAGTLLTYSVTTGDFSTAGNFGADNLNDGDATSTSDGTYAIATNGTPVTLDFGGTATLGSVAFYIGYGNRVDGNYTLKDGSGTVLGEWSISGTGTNNNQDVPSFWLTFDTPVNTDQLVVEFTTSEPLGGVPMTASFREIEVFGPQFFLDPANAAFQSLAQSATQPVSVTYDVSDGTTTTPTTATWTVTGVNDAPVLTDVNPTPAAFLENTVNAGAVAIDTDVTLTDVDSVNFEGGNLTVEYAAGGSAEDSISLLVSATPNTGVEVSGTTVSFNNTAIGTIVKDGTAGGDFAIDFNQGGNPDAATVE
ncbi:MAG: tandem-95 repeat protein, partial [Pseudomonadota bacterium]